MGLGASRRQCNTRPVIFIPPKHTNPILQNIMLVDDNDETDSDDDVSNVHDDGSALLSLCGCGCGCCLRRR
jgi:hypothetical protein